MNEPFCASLSALETRTLSSIVQVGVATYKDLMESQHPMFSHPYFIDVRGRVCTKLVQIQCEVESHDQGFPFVFSQRSFSYGHCIPQLHTKNMILHIARSTSPDALSYRSKYKVELSNRNTPLCRQLILNSDGNPPVIDEPYYGILVFGGAEKLFASIQFPTPGYEGIADSIDIPMDGAQGTNADATEAFERKKAGLKREFLARETKEGIS